MALGRRGGGPPSGVLDDEEVDALIIGIVPMSPALATLGAGDEPETIAAVSSLARTLPPLFAATNKG